MTFAAFVMLAVSTSGVVSTSGAVAPAMPSADKAHVEDAIRAGLQQRFPGVHRWEIRRFSEANTPPMNDDVQVVRLGARSAVRVDGRLQWFAVEGWQNVVSATRSVGNGQALDESFGQVSERDVLSVSCEPLTDRAQLNGMRARKQLRDDEVICTQSVEVKPTVARGETVTVRYVGPRIVLLTKGIAKTDGNIGDRLVVQSPRSSDSFPARVSGAGEVTVHE
jgi:flagella basal body P-ring formation protein FlgA